MDADLTLNAYHEAGHVLMAHLLGGEVLETTLEMELEGHLGSTSVEWRGVDDLERTRRSSLVALAGPVAEVLWRGETMLHQDFSAWLADWAEVEAGLAACASEAEREQTRIQWLGEIAQTLQDAETWERLCRVADGLEAHGTLDRALLAELLP